MTPDGRSAISASSDHTVKVWDLENGSIKHNLLGHTNVVSSVAITPDGKLGVSGGFDQKIKIWDLSKGMEVSELNGHRGPISPSR